MINDIIERILALIYIYSTTYLTCWGNIIDKIKEYLETHLYKYNTYHSFRRTIYNLIPFLKDKFICTEYNSPIYSFLSILNVRDIEFIFVKFIEYDKHNKIKLLENHIICVINNCKFHHNNNIKLYELIRGKNYNKYLLNEYGIIEDIEEEIEEILKSGNYFLCFQKKYLNIYTSLENTQFQLQAKFLLSYNFCKAFILKDKMVRIFNGNYCDFSFITLKIKNCKIIEKSNSVICDESHINLRVLNNGIIVCGKGKHFALFSINKEIITKIKEIYLSEPYIKNLFITQNLDIYGYNTKNIYKLDFKIEKAYRVLFDKNEIISVNSIENDKNLFLIQNNDDNLKICGIPKYYIIKHYIMLSLELLPIIFLIFILIILKINIIKTTIIFIIFIIILRLFEFGVNILFSGAYTLKVVYSLLSIICNKIVNTYLFDSFLKKFKILIFVLLLCLEISLFGGIISLIHIIYRQKKS